MNRRKRTPGPRYQPIASVIEEAFPEHAKMNPHVEASWAIREFLAYLGDRGIFLHKLLPGQVLHVDYDQVEDELLKFRGVDVAAYRAETDTLLAKYPSARPDQVNGTTDPDEADLMRVVTILDGLGVPAWAGRPTCAQALRDAGITQPDTNVFARVVRLRKSMYGVVDQYSGHEQPELPLELAKAKSKQDEGLAVLLGKLRGAGDVREEE